MRFEGALLGHVRGVVFGWACADDGAEVVVEILGDDEPLALARSGVRLPEGSGHPAHRAASGFFAVIGPDRIDRVGRITARIANLDCPIDGAVFPARDPEVAEAGEAGVLQCDGLRLRGWVLPVPLEPRGPGVFAFENGQCVAQGAFRPVDPFATQAGAPEGALAFDLALPLALADGRTHRIVVCSEDGRALPCSPMTVCLPAQGDRRWIDALPLDAADRDLLRAMAERTARERPLSVGWSSYRAWKARFGAPPSPPSDAQVLVVVGPHRAGPGEVRETIASLVRQSHPRWRALVWIDADLHDAPGADAQAGLATRDARVSRVPAHRWAEALAREVPASPFASFLHAGDQWHPETLGHALAALAGGADLCYCDADGGPGAGGPPWFKPDWCEDTFLALPLLDHGFVCRGGLLARPSPRPEDWPWQAIDAAGGRDARVAHVPHPLHTCGEAPSCTAPRAPRPVDAATGVDRAGIARRRFGAAKWQRSHDGPHAVAWPDPSAWPDVGVIVPTRDRHDLLRTCIDGLRATDYPRLSITVIDNQSTCSRTLAYLGELEAGGVRIIRWPHPFNYAAMHQHAVAALGTEAVCLVNNDVRALRPDWLRAMVRHLVRPGVGAVGAKLLWPNGMVQHAGVVLGLHGVAGHAGNLWRADDPGYHHSNAITRSVGAATAACLLVRRADYLAVGGMDAHAFPVAFNDVDLCLKLRRAGWRIVWAHDAVLEHAESASRGADDAPSRRARADREHAAMVARWAGELASDPFYNPNLALDRYSHDGLAVPPRADRRPSTRRPEERSP